MFTQMSSQQKYPVLLPALSFLCEATFRRIWLMAQIIRKVKLLFDESKQQEKIKDLNMVANEFVNK